MKVRMLVSLVIGHSSGFGAHVCAPGEEMELPEGEAMPFIAAGYAESLSSEPVEQRPVPETATAPKGEQATRVGKTRGR